MSSFSWRRTRSKAGTKRLEQVAYQCCVLIELLLLRNLLIELLLLRNLLLLLLLTYMRVWVDLAWHFRAPKAATSRSCRQGQEFS